LTSESTHQTIPAIILNLKTPVKSYWQLFLKGEIVMNTPLGKWLVNLGKWLVNNVLSPLNQVGFFWACLFIILLIVIYAIYDRAKSAKIERQKKAAHKKKKAAHKKKSEDLTKKTPKRNDLNDLKKEVALVLFHQTKPINKEGSERERTGLGFRVIYLIERSALLAPQIKKFFINYFNEHGFTQKWFGFWESTTLTGYYTFLFDKERGLEEEMRGGLFNKDGDKEEVVRKGELDFDWAGQSMQILLNQGLHKIETIKGNCPRLNENRKQAFLLLAEMKNNPEEVLFFEDFEDFEFGNSQKRTTFRSIGRPLNKKEISEIQTNYLDQKPEEIVPNVRVK